MNPKCFLQVLQALCGIQVPLWGCFAGAEKQMGTDRNVPGFTEADCQLFCLVIAALTAAGRMYGYRDQHIRLPVPDCLLKAVLHGSAIKIKIFPAVFVFDRRQGMTGSIIIMKQGGAGIKGPLVAYTVQTVFVMLAKYLLAALSAGWLPDRYQAWDTRPADQLTGWNNDSAANRTPPWE